VRWVTTPPQIGRDRLDDVARQSGLTPADGAEMAVRVSWSTDSELTYDPSHRRLTDEFYRLDLGAVPGDDVEVTVTGDRSLRWALIDLADRARSGQWDPGEQRHGPGFAVRGVIEGFYGSQWSDETRLDMVDFMARKRFNTFLYSPKDDAYLRREWRAPFDERGRHRLAELIAHCRDRDVDPMVGISPGLSMRYSSEEDATLLSEKIAYLVELGANPIALLFDDIPQTLQHPADIEIFLDLATAHAETANRVRDRLGAGTLVVCPTVYWGDGDEEYISRLSDLLDHRIDLFWTGRAICSPAITATEAAHFTRSNHRPPLYWDNYPVNDVAMGNEMHIGPYQNRDPLLERFSRGVMANAMEYPEASKIALATIGDFLWDPARYEPERSWESAIAGVAGESDAPALAAFADTVRASCLSDPEPVRVGNALQRFGFELEHGHPEQARSELATLAGELTAAADHLLGDEIENRALQSELRPWLTKFRLGAEAVAALAQGADRNALAAALSDFKQDPHRVFGDVLEMALTDAIT
jgi:hyaluronoglucosaminidase